MVEAGQKTSSLEKKNSRNRDQEVGTSIGMYVEVAKNQAGVVLERAAVGKELKPLRNDEE